MVMAPLNVLSFQHENVNIKLQNTLHSLNNKRNKISRHSLHSNSKAVMDPLVEYGMDAPYKEACYDPHSAETFYRKKQFSSMLRLAQLVTKSSGFLTTIIMDKKLNRQDDMVETRSRELLELVSDLGPTVIKIGQALSTRTDLLPVEYTKGLSGLQDAVPPFSAELGRSIIEQELNIKIDETFSSFSPEPVASASIGQVYKGTLRDSGIDVAVKVQRPNVLNKIALDLFLIRSLAPLYKRSQEINTDLVGLVDAWGEGFVNELDYRKEAETTTAFSKAMRNRGLRSVFAPEVIESLSSVHVLTTKWVEGERLALSDANDVPRLCGVALNAYLCMLFETGTLHCDPHPGNLLRTADGRLCILDFGMVIDVPTDLQLSLLEFIANLNAENYEDVPNDLVKLKFVPKDKLDELRKSGLTVAIASMLKLAGKGGGPKGAMQRMVAQNKAKYADALAEFDDLDSKEATKVRQKLFREDWAKSMAEDAKSRNGDNAPLSTTTELTMNIEKIQEQNADVFAIPDYFIYMARAFSTLEGIGLSSDLNYSILQECYPYLAKRLLSDDSPRARGALRTLLYGKGDELNLTKLRELSSGFESYTASTSSVESSRGGDSSLAIEQLANVVLSENGNYVQDLLLNETAVAIDATVRDALIPPVENLASVPTIRGPLGPFLRPYTIPLDLAKASLRFQRIDAHEKERLENLQALSKLFNNANSGSSSSSSSSNGNTITKIIVEASKRRRALARISMRLGGSLASTQAKRLRKRVGEEHNDVSKLASLLALEGADRLEGLAQVISLLDENLTKRG